MVGAGRIKNSLLLAFASFGLVAGMFLSGLLTQFELKAYDLFSRYISPAWKSDRIVVIEIDQRSIDSLSSQSINWPWPRQIYAPVVDYLSSADAVFIDMLYLEPSSYGEEDDLLFSEAIKKAANVYLPVFLTNQKDTLMDRDREFLERFVVRGDYLDSPRFRSVLRPVDLLASSVKGTGNVTISPDRDGVYRRVPLLFRMAEYNVPHFVLGHLIQQGTVTVKDGILYSHGRTVGSGGSLLLRFSSADEPFRLFSIVDIIESYNLEQTGKTPAISRDFFKGKKVLIGPTAAGLYDLKPTAVSSLSSGVMVHATAIENLLKGDYIRPFGRPVSVAFSLVICLVTSFFVLRYSSVLANLPFLLGMFFLSVAVPALFFRQGLYTNIVSPPLSLSVCFIVSSAFSYATVGKERSFIKNTFSRYMDRRIVDYILDNPDLIQPGGQRKRVTVFFLDIAGFTTMAEKAPPETTARILRRILTAFTEIIIANGGVIDKYIGDCVMAFWGAPLATEDDEINACRSAIQCISELGRMNAEFRAEGFSDISVRVGIHSGDAIAGNLGSDRLFDYTVIGDTVNLASRLESVNKFFGTGIIASEATVDRTKGAFLTRDLGRIEVKGKALAVRVYEVISSPGSADDETNAAISLFHRGLELFGAGSFKEASGIFEEVLMKRPDDGPSIFYLKRCASLQKGAALTEGWDIIKMTEK